MGRNKKLTKAVRERMARTGENYTAARTALIADGDRTWGVEDVEIGTGAVAEVWRTLHVRYVARIEGRVVDESGARPKYFALHPAHVGWMSAMVGQRVGGVRRIYSPRADIRKAGIPPYVFGPQQGRCVIEARLLAVEPYVPDPPREIARGAGRPAAPGDRVRIKYSLKVHTSGAVLATSGEAGIVVDVGAGELEPDLDRVIPGMRAGGTRTAVLPALDGPDRFLWLDLLQIL